MELQQIYVNGSSITINGIAHVLNLDFCQKVDTYSIHISLDANETIRLFECTYTMVNGEMATDAENLATLFGLTITS